jgi:phage head maturation protease
MTTRRNITGPEVRVRSTATNVEVRASTDGSNTFVVTGRALSYGQTTTINDAAGSFRETLHAGMLRNADLTPCVFHSNHGKSGSFPLATVASKTLTLTDTPSGLDFRAIVPLDVESGRDLKSWLTRERGACSFAFTVAAGGDSWSGRDANGLPNVREVHAVDNLYDVSVVDSPAYTEGTSAQISERIAELRSNIVSARAGRKVSAKHKAILADAQSHLDSASAALKTVMNADHPSGSWVPTPANSKDDGSSGSTDPSGQKGTTASDASGSRFKSPPPTRNIADDIYGSKRVTLDDLENEA